MKKRKSEIMRRKAIEHANSVSEKFSLDAFPEVYEASLYDKRGNFFALLDMENNYDSYDANPSSSPQILKTRKCNLVLLFNHKICEKLSKMSKEEQRKYFLRLRVAFCAVAKEFYDSNELFKIEFEEDRSRLSSLGWK